MISAIVVSLIIFSFIFNTNFSNGLTFLSSNRIFKEIFKGEVLGANEFLYQNVNEIDQFTSKEGLVDQISVYSPSKLPTSSSKEDKTIDFNLLAASGAVLDCQESNIIFEKKSNEAKPIASITKLVTALVFLDNNPGWDKIYEIQPQDSREGGKENLFKGEKIRVKDLFYTSLVGSDNTATIALINSTGLTEQEFVIKMNEKINQYNLKRTYFKDPVGLDNNNISTAIEVANFSKIAFTNEEISQACSTKSYEFKTLQGRKKIINNTNELLDNFIGEGIDIIGGKTGYVEASGYCLVSKFRNKVGKEIISVILGAESDKERFSQTKELVNLVYNKLK